MSNSIGDLKNSGLKGNNWPWQYRVLLGLDGILAALNNNDEDFEVAYVTEKCPGPPATQRVLLEVRIWDSSTNTWGTIRYYLPGSNTPVAGPVPAAGCTLEYADASNIRPLTCADEITVCGTSFNNSSGSSSLNVHITNPIPLEVNINEANDSILVYGFDGTANQPISVTASGEVNIRPLTCTDKVSLCFNDGVSNVTVSSTNPLPTTATVSFPTGSITSCDDAVAITFCDTLLTEFLAQGTTLDDIQTNTLNTTNGITTANVTLNNIENELIALNNTAGTLATEATLASVLAELQSTLDVNITNLSLTVATAGANSAPVGMYGSTDLGTNWTAVAVDTFGAISTNTTLVGPTGVQLDCDNAISTALCQTQEDILTDIQSSVAPLTSVIPNILISSGDAPVTIAAAPYSITFFNNGSTSVNVSFDFGVTNVSIPAGVTITMDAGGIKNTYQANQFVVGDTTAVGASMIVTYNS